MNMGVVTALAVHVMFSDGITTTLMLTVDGDMSSPVMAIAAQVMDTATAADLASGLALVGVAGKSREPLPSR